MANSVSLGRPWSCSFNTLIITMLLTFWYISSDRSFHAVNHRAFAKYRSVRVVQECVSDVRLRLAPGLKLDRLICRCLPYWYNSCAGNLTGARLAGALPSCSPILPVKRASTMNVCDERVVLYYMECMCNDIELLTCWRYVVQFGEGFCHFHLRT